MTFRCKSLGLFGVLFCVLSALAANCFSLDREAFSFTNYDLNVQVEPEQHRLGVRGKVTLRNDSQVPQRVAVLQISSSLDWRSIKAGDKTVQYVTQPYTSDMDHTGALSEAIVTLPSPLAPNATIELDIAYEGVILLDATRLTRIGVAEDVANSTDWDQIDAKVTAERGAGNVAWYPIATEVANLSETNDLAEVLARWKKREGGSSIRLQIEPAGEELTPQIFFSGVGCGGPAFYESIGTARKVEYSTPTCTSPMLRWDAPTLVAANYQLLERTAIEVRYLPGHDLAAATFADAAEKIAPLINDWFGAMREKAHTAELPDSQSAPFESGGLLLTPLATTDSKLAGLAAAHQLTHASFLSSRPWIEEGLAHFAQALYLEQQSGRRAALDYMGSHRFAFDGIEAPETDASI